MKILFQTKSLIYLWPASVVALVYVFLWPILATQVVEN